VLKKGSSGLSIDEGGGDGEIDDEEDAGEMQLEGEGDQDCSAHRSVFMSSVELPR